jgi:hypothetical protein
MSRVPSVLISSANVINPSDTVFLYLDYSMIGKYQKEFALLAKLACRFRLPTYCMMSAEYVVLVGGLPLTAIMVHE